MKLMNGRILVLTLVFLILLDAGIGYYVSSLYASPQSYRIEGQDVVYLKDLIEQVKKDRGIKIAFVGDSAVYGSSVAEAKETIPAYTAGILHQRYPWQDIKVYNLAMKGYGISEAYFVIKALEDAGVDLVIYNVSIGWFGREELMEHPAVLALAGRDYPMEHFAELGLEPPVMDYSLEGRLKQGLERYWNLYRYRYLISQQLLGKPLSKQFDDLYLSITNPALYAGQSLVESEIFLPWWEKEWEVKFQGLAGWKFGEIYLGPENHQLQFYRLILDTLVEKSVPAIFFITPQNLELLEMHQLLNREAAFEKIRFLQELTQELTEDESGVNFLNYLDQVDYLHFSDTIHLLAGGNAQVAEMLAAEIEKLELIGE